MFQTEINHFLQGIDAWYFGLLMEGISYLGHEWVITLLFLVFIYGIDFKRGVILVQVVVWTGVITVFFKNLINLPRPYDVDASLKDFGADYTIEGERLVRAGAEKFFSGLPGDTLSVLRGSGIKDFGFPSAHVSLTTSLWGTIALFFRSRWVWILCLTLIFLMPFSRIYLARHFLADTLGGLAIGTLCLVVLWYSLIKPEKFNPYLKHEHWSIRFDRSGISRALLLYVAPFFFFLIPTIEPSIVLMLLGFNFGFSLVTRKHFPQGVANLLKRIARVIIILGLFAANIFLVHWLARISGYGETLVMETLVDFSTMFVPILVGTSLCLKLGFYELKDK